MVSLLNDIRLNLGKPPLGFLNPLLYQLSISHPEVFHPVLSEGISNNCKMIGENGHQRCCQYGFAGSEGPWNPLTGLGTINFKNLASVVSKLP